MEKYRQHQFCAQQFPRSLFSELRSSQKYNFDWGEYFKQPRTLTSMAKQLRQSLHQMVTSLVGLLIACSDIFFLLAHILRVLYQIVESVLIFVMSACKIIWLLIMCSLFIIVRIWDFLFYNPGPVAKVFELCCIILGVLYEAFLYITALIFFSIFVGILLNARNANHLDMADQKFYSYHRAQ